MPNQEMKRLQAEASSRHQSRRAPPTPHNGAPCQPAGRESAARAPPLRPPVHHLEDRRRGRQYWPARAEAAGTQQVAADGRRLLAGGLRQAGGWDGAGAARCVDAAHTSALQSVTSRGLWRRRWRRRRCKTTMCKLSSSSSHDAGWLTTVPLGLMSRSPSPSTRHASQSLRTLSLQRLAR